MKVELSYWEFFIYALIFLSFYRKFTPFHNHVKHDHNIRACNKLFDSA